MEAIDGARTRGLDLGKVARYQLRHYRIHPPVSRDDLLIISKEPLVVNAKNNFLKNAF